MSRDIAEFLTVMFFIVLLIAVFVFVGCQYGIEQTRDDAVKSGAGEYYIEKDTNLKSFRWTPKN
jgi:hypothetical protein